MSNLISQSLASHVFPTHPTLYPLCDPAWRLTRVLSTPFLKPSLESGRGCFSRLVGGVESSTRREQLVHESTTNERHFEHVCSSLSASIVRSIPRATCRFGSLPPACLICFIFSIPTNADFFGLPSLSFLLSLSLSRSSRVSLLSVHPSRRRQPPHHHHHHHRVYRSRTSA